MTVDAELQKVLSDSLGTALTDHEAVCLENILRNHKIQLSSGKSFELTDKEIAALLAELAKEYLEQLPSPLPAEEALRVKTEYWSKRIGAIRSKDEPLTFSDRTTIARLLDTIKQHQDVSDVHFSGGGWPVTSQPRS